MGRSRTRRERSLPVASPPRLTEIDGSSRISGRHQVDSVAALGALEDGGYRRMIVDAVERDDGQLRSS